MNKRNSDLKVTLVYIITVKSSVYNLACSLTIVVNSCEIHILLELCIRTPSKGLAVDHYNYIACRTLCAKINYCYIHICSKPFMRYLQ